MTVPDRIWTKQTSGWSELERGQYQNTNGAGGNPYLASTPPREHAEELVEALAAAIDSLNFSQAELRAQASIPQEDSDMITDRLAWFNTLLAKIEQENTNE